MKILVFAPHADDEILGVGGTIAKYIDEGHEVFICVITSGHPSMFKEELLSSLRKEAIAAHKYLGIRETIFLDFPAVMLNEVPKFQINQKIQEIIGNIIPNVVYIPHFGDMHNDHTIVSQACMVALRPINNHKVEEVYSYETLSETEWNLPHSSNTFLPNTYVNISKYINKKITAIEYFNTQIKDFPHPRSSKAIISLANLRGSTIGVEAAEAFSLIRKISS